jgi:hypothetical protein
MPHLEKGKRHFCKGIKVVKCLICEKMKEIPSNKKVNVCIGYACQEEWNRRVKARKYGKRPKKESGT